MVDVTHALYNFCSHQIDINIGDLTSSIAYIFSYFDNTTQSEIQFEQKWYCIKLFYCEKKRHC